MTQKKTALDSSSKPKTGMKTVESEGRFLWPSHHHCWTVAIAVKQWIWVWNVFTRNALDEFFLQSVKQELIWQQASRVLHKLWRLSSWTHMTFDIFAVKHCRKALDSLNRAWQCYHVFVMLDDEKLHSTHPPSSMCLLKNCMLVCHVVSSPKTMRCCLAQNGEFHQCTNAAQWTDVWHKPSFPMHFKLCIMHFVASCAWGRCFPSKGHILKRSIFLCPKRRKGTTSTPLTPLTPLNQNHKRAMCCSKQLFLTEVHLAWRNSLPAGFFAFFFWFFSLKREEWEFSSCMCCVLETIF